MSCQSCKARLYSRSVFHLVLPCHMGFAEQTVALQLSLQFRLTIASPAVRTVKHAVTNCKHVTVTP